MHESHFMEIHSNFLLIHFPDTRWQHFRRLYCTVKLNNKRQMTHSAVQVSGLQHMCKTVCSSPGNAVSALQINIGNYLTVLMFTVDRVNHSQRVQSRQPIPPVTVMVSPVM